VECHEVWAYDDVDHVQSLVRVIAICPRCHLVKHIGHAQIEGKLDEAVAHMRKVNGWTSDQAKTHIREAFNKWQERSKYPWTLILDVLEVYGHREGGLGLLPDPTA
jgi:hypothetical protein